MLSNCFRIVGVPQDAFPSKVNVGVGAFRDEAGKVCPVVLHQNHVANTLRNRFPLVSLPWVNLLQTGLALDKIDSPVGKIA